jgi:radical SAM protein with 4Fe4S-binding SPASM domain
MDPPTDKKRSTDSTKLLWHMDRVIQHYNGGERVAPIHIDVGLTKTCNADCIFCYGAYQNMNGAIMSRKAVIDNLVNSAADIGVRSLAYIGDGEPTCNPAYWDALKVGKSRGLYQQTSTNGILVNNDERRAAILENCNWMRFSLSAGTREGYKAIHRVDKWDVVKKNVEDLVKYKDKHNLKCDIGVQMDLMAKEVIPEAKFALESGVDYFLIKQCSLPDAGETGMAQFDVKAYDDSRMVELLQQAQSMSNERTDIVPKWNIINLKGAKKYEHCVGVQLIPEVSGNGDVYPCAYFFGNPKYDDYKYGSLEDSTLEQIVSSERYWKIVKRMNEEFDPKTQCKGCCRQDKSNEFIWEYLHPPKGLNRDINFKKIETK